MSKEMKNAEELVKHHPGVFDRRQAIILSLCSAAKVGSTAITSMGARELGLEIVEIANTIVEQTEQ